MYLVLLLAFVGLVIAAMVLFGPRDNVSGAPVDERLLVSQQFHARRAFQVEEFEDEGSSYFIELADGSVLFLSGQYLYDYEPIDDDPELKQPRRFPCTEFVIRRHPAEHYVYDIACSGEVLEPEGLAPLFTTDEYELDRAPEDGQILTGESYDVLKARWLDARAAARGHM